MKECDLIMKGGLTSGIVYPSAIKVLSNKYRLKNIGGASAGAIAAVAAAAAEYRRQSSPNKDDISGFEDLNKVPNDIGSNLVKLFRPTPVFQPLFNFLLAMLENKNKKKAEAADEKKLSFLGKIIRKIGLTLKYFSIAPFATLIGSLICLTGLVYSVTQQAYGFVCFIITIWFLLLVLAPTLKVKKLLSKNLVAQNFGMCTGLREGKKASTSHPALTEWLCDQIDGIAYGQDYLKSSDRVPLTVGDLSKHDISVKAMTTDLSTGRPYELPLQTGVFYFKKKELQQLFPAYVVKYICELPRNEKRDQDGYLAMPLDDEIPAIMIARMSLSFPVLISAVPLYQRHDLAPKGKDGKAPWVRCLFSDGGISSNFPIHFFDELLPKRPAFGISLANYDPLIDKNKVTNAEHASQTLRIPAYEYNGYRWIYY